METINDIIINAKSSFLKDKSNIQKSLFFFIYEIIIENKSDKTFQLMSRHWEISDANKNTQIIDGEGVVGERPILKPGDSFNYNSFCPIKTEFGTMSGFYIFKEHSTDSLFKAIIPEFVLVATIIFSNFFDLDTLSIISCSNGILFTLSITFPGNLLDCILA